ncbi:Lysine-specific demethylase JMJ703 [Euphorbia peplus]|nr:Lysine-specific demethylase JMJ703 [Euphorbia peplus]
MGTKLMRVCVKEENDEIMSVPPGFESFASFTLKRVHEDENQKSDDMISCSASTSTVEIESQPAKMEVDSGSYEDAKLMMSLRDGASTNYGQSTNNSGGEFDFEKLKQNPFLRTYLPKGVIRGCPQCSNCQKVIAKWHPEFARRPDLEDAPAFYPTEEEFEDTLKYIASIRQKAEPYGICRIVPPPSWKPPCPLKEQPIWESSKFSTRVQRVDKLQNRDSLKKMSRMYNNARKKRRRCMRMPVNSGTDIGNISGCSDAGVSEIEFGFEPGPEFTLNTFQKYADDFKNQYFTKDSRGLDDECCTTVLHENWEPTVDNIEGEYWRIVEKASEEIEVLYGADLETGVFGSGFPKKSNKAGSDTDERYAKSGWNLNNFPRLPGSVLSYESGDISGVLVPWLYIGMCFSSFCWHVEDHHLYSLNYMHWGSPKMWYGVPGKDAIKMEEAMRKHLPDLFEEQPDLLHKLVTQLSPAILKSDGVPVYRCVQNPGEFVLTFPRAYHSGFNCGFNCAEAVNVAPVDWLPHGQIAMELYRDQGRRTSISHDKLLLGASRDAVKAHWELNLLKKNTSDNLRWLEVCGKDGILAKALKERVEMERTRRGFLSSSSQAVKMENNFDATSERECSICLFDLHLSAAGCQCSPDKYACLNHAKQMCPCGMSTKIFLFRYDISELNILVEALEGKLSAVYRWARLDLGLALTSSISRDTSEGATNKLMRSKPALEFLKHIGSKGLSTEMTVGSTKTLFETASLARKAFEAEALKGTRASSMPTCTLEVIEKQSHGSKLIKGGLEPVSGDLKTQICQLSQEDLSYAGDLTLVDCGIKNSPVRPDEIILLSDDEGDEAKETVFGRANKSSPAKRLELSDRPDKASRSNGSPLNDSKGSILIAPATEIRKNNVTSVSNQRSKCLFKPVQLKEENHQRREIVLGCSASNSYCHPRIASSNAQDSSAIEIIKDQNSAKARCQDPPQPQSDIAKPSDGDIVGENATSNPVDNNLRAMPGGTSCSQNNLDRYFRQKGQKGPRIAKLVRRITCNVEPLEYGVVLSGKSWCSSQAIFPKGFRSRVKYMSVLDPTNMSYYVSEILDAGQNRPLFMVLLEQCPSEVFIHVSAVRCWEMVRERVNQEITKQHKMGKTNLPPLQPPGSLDGLEMFGFSSPSIVQAIEALDRNRLCTDYWDSRPYSRPQGQIPQHSQPQEITDEENNKGKPRSSHPIPEGLDTLLRGLFKKANSEELSALSRIFNDSELTVDPGYIGKLVNEENNIHTSNLNPHRL